MAEKIKIYMSTILREDGTWAWIAMAADGGNASQGSFNSKEEARAAGESQEFKGKYEQVWNDPKIAS